MAWVEFSDIPLGYQGRAKSKLCDSAPFDHYASGSSQGGQDQININNFAWTGRDQYLLLADRLKIFGLSQHPAGDRYRRISPLDGDRDRDRSIRGDLKGLYVGCRHRL